MQDRPFFGIFEFFVLVAFFVSNISDFIAPADHPPSRLVVAGWPSWRFALRSDRTLKHAA